MTSDTGDGLLGKGRRPPIERRSGKDRRKSTGDRRDSIRFEPEADPRRSGKDRRKENIDWKDPPPRRGDRS